MSEKQQEVLQLSSEDLVFSLGEIIADAERDRRRKELSGLMMELTGGKAGGKMTLEECWDLGEHHRWDRWLRNRPVRVRAIGPDGNPIDDWKEGGCVRLTDKTISIQSFKTGKVIDFLRSHVEIEDRVIIPTVKEIRREIQALAKSRERTQQLLNAVLVRMGGEENREARIVALLKKVEAAMERGNR